MENRYYTPSNRAHICMGIWERTRPEQKRCTSCGGSGKHLCTQCNGKGYYYPRRGGPSVSCPDCTRGYTKCRGCSGTGVR